MADDNYDDKYTKPELRRRLKKEIMESDKGGEPGQWSARKSQLLVQRYEAEGGGYEQDEKDEAAKSLEEWSNQQWQTRGGTANAAQEDGMKRYLPVDAWALLKDADQKNAESVKLAKDDKGEQFASWTEPVRDVMTELGVIDDGTGLTKSYLYDRAKELDINGRSKMDKDELKEAIIDAYDPDKTGALSAKTKDEIYELASEMKIDDRSKMDKDELVQAVKEKQLST